MDVETRARDALNEAHGSMSGPYRLCDTRNDFPAMEALCRLIEQQDAFRREVSDAVQAVLAGLGEPLRYHEAHLSRFILPEPVDPIEAQAMEIVRAFYPEVSSTYNGRRKAIAIEAIKRGMALTTPATVDGEGAK